MSKALIESFFYIIPFFAGLFAVTSKPAPIHLEYYLARYIIFVLLFLVWSLFKKVVFWRLDEKSRPKKISIIKFCSLAILGALTLILIALAHHRFEKTTSDLILLALGISAISSRYFFIKSFRKALWLDLLFNTIIAFISFQMVIFKWQWEPIIFSLAIATLVSSVGSARLIDESTHGSNEAASLITAHKIFVLLSPALIILLACTGSVPRAYFILTLLIPISTNYIVIQDKQPDGRYIFRNTVLYCSLFLVILGILEIFT